MFPSAPAPVPLLTALSLAQRPCLPCSSLSTTIRSSQASRSTTTKSFRPEAPPPPPSTVRRSAPTRVMAWRPVPTDQFRRSTRIVLACSSRSQRSQATHVRCACCTTRLYIIHAQHRQSICRPSGSLCRIRFPGTILFAVYDGHGPHGHNVSQEVNTHCVHQHTHS